MEMRRILCLYILIENENLSLGGYWYSRESVGGSNCCFFAENQEMCLL